MSENGMDLGGGFASLLQNPEIAAKLPRIMEALAPVMAEMKAEKSDSENATEKSDAEAATASAAAGTPDAAALMSMLGGIGKKNEGSSRRCTLLRALEPYLSDNRKEAMEYILKVSSLIDILSEVM